MVEISVVNSAVPNSIVFLNTRQAMIFISTTFGTAKSILRTSGFDGSINMITDITFKVTMVLWNEKNFVELFSKHET
jgi:hypothetical protein